MFLPNLFHGVLSSKNDKSNKKDPVLSVQDEHDCLWVAFSSLVDIYLRGGIKATVMGRDVIVKPWIHFFLWETPLLITVGLAILMEVAISHVHIEIVNVHMDLQYLSFDHL